MANETLMEIESMKNQTFGLGGEKLTIKDDGLYFGLAGIATIIGDKTNHVAWNNISSVEIQKIFFGNSYNLIITELGGNKNIVTRLSHYDADEAVRFINEMQQYITSQNLSSSQSNSNANFDFTEQLLNLAKLKEAGILTQEEFNEQKIKILSSK